MKLYVGRQGDSEDEPYLLSRKPFRVFHDEAYVLRSRDKDGEVVVCSDVWHRLGGTRLTPLKSRCIDLTLTIKPIKKGLKLPRGQKGHS